MNSKILQVFTNRRIAITFLLGIASGLPFALTGSTLQAWMKSEGVDLATIGLFSGVGAAYAFKFVWSPFLDRFRLPFLQRRTGWIALFQILLALAIASMGFCDPKSSPWIVALIAVALAFFAASQDIVIDAYRIELLKPDELGAGAAVVTLGWRIGFLLSGAFALIISDHMPWRNVYLVMSCLMALCVLMAVFAPKTEGQARPPRTIAEAVVQPFVSFFSRQGAVEMLFFIILFKLGDVIGTALLTPFYLEMGFARTDIGAINKGFGMIVTIVGALIGGGIVAKLGIRKSLWILGVTQGLANLVFVGQFYAGKSYPMLFASIGTENFFGGMGTAAFTAFMMRICSKRFTATQYALLSSLMRVGPIVGGMASGFLAQKYGWVSYYCIATVASVPGLLLLLRFKDLTDPDPEGV